MNDVVMVIKFGFLGEAELVTLCEWTGGAVNWVRSLMERQLISCGIIAFEVQISVLGEFLSFH